MQTMLSYRLKCKKKKKKAESKKPRVSKTNKVKLMLLSKCAVCDRFIIYDLPIVILNHFLKTKKEYKNLKKRET